MKHPIWWGDRIVAEIESGCNQKRAALLYSMLMTRVSAIQPDYNFVRVNNAILKRWPKGLIRVKEAAWKLEGTPIPDELFDLEAQFYKTSACQVQS